MLAAVEFDQDLPDHADARFLDVNARELVEIADDRTAHFLELCVRERLFLSDKGDDFFFPFFMERIGRPLHRLIRSGAVDAAHENIAEYQGVKSVLDQRKRCWKPGFASSPLRFKEMTGTSG